MTKKPTGNAAEIKRLIALRMSGGDIEPGMEDLSKPLRVPMGEDEFRDWRRRTVAELISLPVICPARRCRRRRKCCADEAVCLERHRDKAERRVNLMMGWYDANIFDEEEDDLSW